MSEPQFLKTRIILPVSDIYDTIAWYERALGFQARYVHGSGRRGEAENFANYAIMNRDAVEVHFILDEGGPIWTRAGAGHRGLTVRDVDAVYSDRQWTVLECRRSGPANRDACMRRYWRPRFGDTLEAATAAARGFILTDPSGNEVHIEQPI